jgi:tyrosyl-DNA phosphodiesterase-1
MDPVRGSSEADAIDLCDSSDGDGDDGGGDGAAAPCSSAGTDPGAPSEGNRILGRLHAERMKRAGRGGDGDGTGGGAGKRRRPMPISMPMPMPKSMPPPPFRLFAAFPPGGEAGARPHRSTLRQILGVDKDPGGGSAGGLGPMQWIVIANFLIDFDWLLDEVPELLSLRRAVVYYGHACGGSPPNRWGRAGARAGAGAGAGAVDLVRMVPSDPPGSAANPLPYRMPYGVHHAKMFLVGYRSSLRLVVHTANLHQSQVELQTNGAYVRDFPLKAPFAAPLAPPSSRGQALLTSRHGSSDDAFALSSRFEEQLVAYLESYRRGDTYVWPLGLAEAEGRGGAGVVDLTEDGDGTGDGTGDGPDVPLSLVDVVRRYDFSGAGVSLVASVPGWHGIRNCPWGHLALRRAVAGTAKAAAGSGGGSGSDRDGGMGCSGAAGPAGGEGGPILCQYTSVGALSDKWLKRELEASLDVGRAGGGLPGPGPGPKAAGRGRSPATATKMKLIWPTCEEVRTSHGGYRIGDAIPGRTKNVDRDFLRPLYHRWALPGGTDDDDSDPLGTARAAPHIKTFLQLSRDQTSIEWACLTSHNLSKAAWGEVQNSSLRGETLVIRHWELGIFVSPKTLTGNRISDPDGTLVRMVPYQGGNVTGGDHRVVLPLPFDVQPTPYGQDDIPWSVDRVNSQPDQYGRLGCMD